MTPFAISRDATYTQTAWSQALDLGEIQFLSDWNGDAVRGFGVGHEFRGMKDVAERSTFLVERGGEGERAGGEVERAGERYNARAAASGTSKSGTSPGS